MELIQNTNNNINLTEEIKNFIDFKFKDRKEDEELELLFYSSKKGENKFLSLSDNNLTDDSKNYSNRIFAIKNDFNRIKTMYNMLISEVADYNKTSKYSIKDIKRVTQEEANRNFLNLLSIGKLFVDFNENQVKKLYGKESQEYTNFHSFATTLYDNSDVYRLFCNLRNFSQHYALPVTLIETSMINDTDYKCQYFLELEYLIGANFNWQNIVFEDLKTYISVSKTLETNPLVMKYFQAITILYGQYNEFFLNIHFKELIKIKDYLEDQGLNEGKYYLGKFTKRELLSLQGELKLQDVFGKVEIDRIFIDLSKLGLVKIKM